MPHRRRSGLPRRFAPRNDMQKPAACPHEQLRAAMANSYVLFRIRPKYYFLLCPAAGVTDCRVALLLAMTCRNLPPVRMNNYVLPWQICYAFRIRLRHCSLLRPTAGEADCRVALLRAMTC